MSDGNDDEVTSGGRHCPTTLTMADVNDEDAKSGGRRRPTKADKQKIVFPPAGMRGGTHRPTVVVKTVDENSSTGEESQWLASTTRCQERRAPPAHQGR